jgi:hypothetical protein
MMLTTLTLLLLSADPAQPAPSAPSLAVVSTSTPGLEKVAGEAGRTLGTRLEATYVDLGGFLKSRGAGCQNDLRCLVTAPGLSGASRLLHLRLRPLSPGRLAADLRLIEVRTRKSLGRSASVVEQGELAAWLERASSQIFTQVDPFARHPPPSPFAVKPAAEEVAPVLKSRTELPEARPGPAPEKK